MWVAFESVVPSGLGPCSNHRLSVNWSHRSIRLQPIGERKLSEQRSEPDAGWFSYAYRDRMLSMLHIVQEELPNPLYFDHGRLARAMHTHIPQNKLLRYVLSFLGELRDSITFLVRSALLNAGYQVSGTHARKDAIKTNAPHAVIWDIMRAFAGQSSTKRAAEERLKTDSAYYRLLTKPSTIQVDFTEHPNWESEARKNKLIRFTGNPHARWGPLGKAVTKKKRPAEENESTQNKKPVRITSFNLYTLPSFSTLDNTRSRFIARRNPVILDVSLLPLFR